MGRIFGIMSGMKLHICTLAVVLAASIAHGEEPTTPVATAEFGRNEIRLYANPLAYEVLKDGTALVPKTDIGLCLDGKCVAKDAKALGVKASDLGKSSLATPVYKKGAVDLEGREAVAEFADFSVRLVARKDGVAYRFELKNPGVVTCEKADLTVPKSARCWFNRTGRKSLGCEETVPEFADAGALPSDKGKAFYLPFVYSVGGNTVAVTETGLHDYPILNFGDIEETESGAKLKSLFAKYPKATERVGGWGKERGLAKGGRWVKVVETEDFIAKSAVPRALPWRVFALADSPAKLCEADISYALATPAAKGADFSWVKPGKVAWDWWNAFDNKGDPKGCTTETYVRFIDFAAKTGVEYVIFDEGWSAKLDIWKNNPAVDVPEIIRHGKEKGVGIILWMAWAQVVGDEDHVAEHFAKLGAKGFKVDFMDRGDAEVERFLWKFAESCRRNRMLIDYHGSHRPTGLRRAYPNVLNSEGVHGLEQMKWNDGDVEILDNDVKLCYTRMTAGPMDYTPGAMDNYAIGKYPKKDRKFAGRHYAYTHPGSVGTRCRQMAMMALYDAPLQMLCDSPTKYERNMECFSFMAATPTTWDETVGLFGTPDTCAVVARRKGDVWYVAGITNAEGRYYTFDTSFLPDGDWNMEIFKDASDSNENATSYVHTRLKLRKGESMVVRMAPGGGFVARFTK